MVNWLMVLRKFGVLLVDKMVTHQVLTIMVVEVHLSIQLLIIRLMGRI